MYASPLLTFRPIDPFFKIRHHTMNAIQVYALRYISKFEGLRFMKN